MTHDVRRCMRIDVVVIGGGVHHCYTPLSCLPLHHVYLYLLSQNADSFKQALGLQTAGGPIKVRMISKIYNQ